MALGIKNSWKYEKDLIIIFNLKQRLLAITKWENFIISLMGTKKYLQKIFQHIIVYRWLIYGSVAQLPRGERWGKEGAARRSAVNGVGLREQDKQVDKRSRYQV